MIRTLPADLPGAALACTRCAAGACCMCGSGICLHLSIAAQQQRAASASRIARHFANPATFGHGGEQETNVSDQCTTHHTARTHASTHSRPSAGQQGRRGRANQAGSNAPAGE